MNIGAIQLAAVAIVFMMLLAAAALNTNGGAACEARHSADVCFLAMNR